MALAYIIGLQGLTGAPPTPSTSSHAELGSLLFSSRPRNSVFTNPGDID